MSESAEPSGMTIRCPHCGGEILITAEFAAREVSCPHCHGNLTAPPLPVSQGAQCPVTTQRVDRETKTGVIVLGLCAVASLATGAISASCMASGVLMWIVTFIVATGLTAWFCVALLEIIASILCEKGMPNVVFHCENCGALLRGPAERGATCPRCFQTALAPKENESGLGEGHIPVKALSAPGLAWIWRGLLYAVFLWQDRNPKPQGTYFCQRCRATAHRYLGDQRHTGYGWSVGLRVFLGSVAFGILTAMAMSSGWGQMVVLCGFPLSFVAGITAAARHEGRNKLSPLPESCTNCGLVGDNVWIDAESPYARELLQGETPGPENRPAADVGSRASPKKAKPVKALAIFLAVFGAITLAVVLFAPERLPFGIGLKPLPVKVAWRESLVGKGRVAIISNRGDVTLKDVRIICRNSKLNEKKVYTEESWAPGKTVELGWAQEWRFEPGEILEISASGHRSKSWKVGQNRVDRDAP